jgi:hypothetical protein
MKPTLFVLAAGMGSRYGGLKQLDSLGPNGETIMDYSIYDAIQSGFGKVVFVIRKDFEQEFRDKIISKYEGHVPVEVVFQSTDALPKGFECPADRTKPWGTNHAVLMGKSVINEPFAVINADDFYGREAYEKLYEFLKSADLEGEKLDLCMVGYQVQNTISENGYVSRGVCATRGGMLTQVVERTKIGRTPEGSIGYSEDDGESWVQLPPETPVSMQFWGFTPGFTRALEEEYARFFREDLPKNPLKGEFYLPFAVNAMLQAGRAQVRVLETAGKWYGVTYRVDRQSVVDALEELTDKGEYPTPLWG